MHYSIVAWLGVVYGRHVIRLLTGTLQKWSTPLTLVFAGTLLAGVSFGIWKIRGLRKIDASEKPAPQGKASLTV